MKIAVIGDIHSNIEALSKAIDIIQSEECNLVVLIGDVLTYGPNPKECIDLILETTKKIELKICLGNHDNTYNDLIVGVSSYYEKLPSWIKESFDWTLNNINIDRWKSLQFCHSYSFNGIYFSHANPYKINDWKYLNTTEDYSSALDKLKEMSMNLGVFGHTHRRRIFIEDVGGERGFKKENNVVLNNKNNGILNVGSIGQPRGEQESTISLLKVKDREIIIETKHFKYDVKSYLRKVDNLQITVETKTKMKSYFEA